MNSVIRYLIVIALVWSVSACNAHKEPIKLSLAELYRDPAAYNHKLIQLSGEIAHGFEQFTLTDPQCRHPRCGVWVEYGGILASGTMYCCGISAARERTESLVIENIPIPLIQDAQFRKFDERLQRESTFKVKATVIGRFFAGQRSETSHGVSWGGFGHFGCCSLLAIQQIVSIDE